MRSGKLYISVLKVRQLSRLLKTDFKNVFFWNSLYSKLIKTNMLFLALFFDNLLWRLIIFFCIEYKLIGHYWAHNDTRWGLANNRGQFESRHSRRFLPISQLQCEQKRWLPAYSDIREELRRDGLGPGGNRPILGYCSAWLLWIELSYPGQVYLALVASSPSLLTCCKFTIQIKIDG